MSERMEVEESKHQVLAIEEDDELEEFEDENWGESKEEEFDIQQWEEDWEEEQPGDMFTQQLRQELLKP
ncbi:unnamed protein product [Blepharisma stoltei]|uniref:26S proteasome complex subunit SEM1 n=1 Tax=Blepharisma stoltei TaxID=1481888 RepID=A0AAU9J5H2_9CILI|nr:unnamed protein product [Blepharisma stoltei]